MNPRELLVALIKHQGRNQTRASQGTAGRFGSQRAHLPRDDPRDEEDVGADLDFSKYTRDRVDYESGANARDLWTVIYRAAHRRESTRITERSCQRARLFPCGASVEEGARKTCANPPRSMSAPLISCAIRAKLRRMYGAVDACQGIDSQQSPGERRNNESADTRHVCQDYASACGPPRFSRDALQYRASTDDFYFASFLAATSIER